MRLFLRVHVKTPHPIPHAHSQYAYIQGFAGRDPRNKSNTSRTEYNIIMAALTGAATYTYAQEKNNVIVGTLKLLAVMAMPYRIN